MDFSNLQIIGIIGFIIMLFILIISAASTAKNSAVLVIFCLCIFSIPVVGLTYIYTQSTKNKYAKEQVAAMVKQTSVYQIVTDTKTYESSKSVIPNKVDDFYYFTVDGTPVKTKLFRLEYKVPGQPLLDSTAYYLNNAAPVN